MRYKADLATERERQLTTARANQTTGLSNSKAGNCTPEVQFSPFRALSCLLLNQPLRDLKTQRRRRRQGEHQKPIGLDY